MTELIQIFMIAAAQGIGECLPISSSGHNAVINHLFALSGHSLTSGSAEFMKLNILLHAGSLIAVLFVCRQRVMDMLFNDRRLILMLIIASIPTAALGYPVYKFAPWIQDSLPLISVCFIVTGMMLLYTLRLPEGEKTASTMTWRDALLIGGVQALAILPGISRSGATIVTALSCRLKREEAAVFSFMLSIPVIVGGGLLACIGMINDGPESTAPVLSDGFLFAGAVVSCVAGILALLFLLDWLKKGKLWYFAVWVFIMSPLTLLLAVLR